MASKNQRLVVKNVENLLKRKLQNGTITTISEEANFLAGAICVLTTIFGKENKLPSCIPPKWLFNPMGGQSIFDKE